MLVEGLKVVRLMKIVHNIMSLVVSHDDTYGCMDWDSDTVVSYLHKNYSTYNFMYPFIVTMHCMLVIKPLSIKLRK